MQRSQYLLGLVSLIALAGCITTAATHRPSSGLSPDAARHWTADNGNGTYSNPLFYEEFEDPDVIRVGDTYYLAGTTMHMNPAVQLMHSKDLVNWELAGYCMDRLDLGPAYRLEGGEHLRPGHLGALHPLSQRHVLRLLQRQRRRPPGLPLQVDQRSLGAQPTARTGTTCRSSSMTTARSTSSPAPAAPIPSRNSRRTSRPSSPASATRLAAQGWAKATTSTRSTASTSTSPPSPAARSTRWSPAPTPSTAPGRSSAWSRANRSACTSAAPARATRQRPRPDGCTRAAWSIRPPASGGASSCRTTAARPHGLPGSHHLGQRFPAHRPAGQSAQGPQHLDQAQHRLYPGPQARVRP